MNIFKSKIVWIIAGIGLIAVFAFIVFRNYQTKTSFKYSSSQVKEVNHNPQDAVSKAANDAAKNHEASQIDKKILEISDSELFLGDKNAPITIVEYASLSCPHCAAFYSRAFEDLKKDFIDTGKVRFVYRDFPLNQPALAAAAVAVCRVKNEQENREQIYYDFVKGLYKTQDSWAFDPEFIHKLESIALLDGMSQEQFQDCINDQKLQEKILKARMEASKNLYISATPSFFINGEMVSGFIDYKHLKRDIEKHL